MFADVSHRRGVCLRQILEQTITTALDDEESIALQGSDSLNNGTWCAGSHSQ
jgi:hypothetical protein